MNTIQSPVHESSGNPAAEVTVRILPQRGFLNLDLAAVWEFRELLYFLVWRDISVRYKQTVIGIAWAVLQPLLTMMIFTVIFGHFAKMPSDDLPYSIFTFTALLPWTYFSQSISRSSVSLVSDSNLVKKVYFPRLIIPIAGVVAPLVDFGISFLVLLGLMVWFAIPLHWTILAFPIFLLLALLTALAIGLWLAPLNARYRDVGHTIPFLVQFWMFASPVTYSLSIIPEKWRLLYGLNPLVGVIEGFRWALLGKSSPDFGVMGLSALAILALLFMGVVYFKRMEQSFSDIL
jgi:lipopolysaccharide transport system permease protein